VMCPAWANTDAKTALRCFTFSLAIINFSFFGYDKLEYLLNPERITFVAVCGRMRKPRKGLKTWQTAPHHRS
jgi:hypothetical protein